MDVFDAIKSRVSTRNYDLKRPVSEDLIRELIESARLAPSAKNIQGFGYHIITGEDIRKKLRSVNVYKQKFVYTAPVLILGCINPSAYLNSSWKRSRGEVPDEIVSMSMARRDLAISSYGLVLRATELGLGTCYIGDMDTNALSKVIEIPPQFILDLTICVGYKDLEKKRVCTKKNIDDILI